MNKKHQSLGAVLPLNERAQALLKALIERYIEDGEPVGSRALAKESGLDLSPATIRNVMADLEDMGLIMAPHTSAGRIPTDKGYRLFVDSLVTVKPLQERDVAQVRSQFESARNASELLTAASDLLSEVTHMAGVVLLPKRQHAALRQIEFLSLSENRVLAITVTNECEVENRVLHMARSYTPSELQRVANFLNSEFAGKDVFAVRAGLLAQLEQARQDVSEFMRSVVDMAQALFPEQAARPVGQYFVAGKTNLLGFPEMSDTDRMRQLFEAFKHKQEMLDLLDQCLVAQGMQVFIGRELGRDVLDQCSLVTAPYMIEDQVVGVLGVIGPTRMSYERVIPLVDVTARLLGAALKFNH